MAARRNGNRANPAGNGGGDSVPRWVRTLFDLHEVRMAAIERTIEEIKASNEETKASNEEMKAEHEARMARLEQADQLQQRKLEEMRRQTREIVVEISRLDAGRKAESARNLAEHHTMMAALKEIRDSLKVMNSRVGRIEQR